MSMPIFVLPCENGQYIIDTDGCDKQVACILLQAEEDGKERPIRYLSQTLSDSERKLPTTHEKCLTVVCANLLFQPYLKGSRFTVRTDHEALKRLMAMADASVKLAGWRLRFLELELGIANCAGTKHQAAAALSRLLTNGMDRLALDDNVRVLVLAREVLAQTWKQQERKKDEFVTIEQTGDTPAPFLPEAATLANRVGSSEIDIHDLGEFIGHRKGDNECRQAAIPVCKPDARLRYNTDGVLV